MTHELLINGDRVVVLSQTIYRIGRHVHCDICINDATVSRCHATLLLEEGVCKIIDGDYLTGMHSANGLSINGEKLVPSHGAELKHNDEIELSRNTHLKYFQTVQADEYDPDTTLL